MRRTITTLLVLVALAALAYGIQRRLGDLAAGDVSAGVQRAPAPVEVADVVQGEVVLRRTFSGTLEASSSFSVAPKVSGRLRGLDVDIGDAVERGQVVALLDDDEFVQAVNQADAELAVARASESEARSALEIAERALARAEALQKEGLASDSILDDARSDSVAARAHVEVTKAQVARAESALESARIRSGYTKVVADWGADAGRRVVAERFVDDGEIVSANTALLSIVQLDPVVAVVSVPERDYARLAVGQPATLVTDSYPGRTFDGAVSRIAPVFRAATRQARVELTVANPGEELKPGMFVRATLELERTPETTVVPYAALTTRGGETGVFVLAEDGKHVAWRPVVVGVREGDVVEVRGDGVTGSVVTLGQELCDDGAEVTAVRRGAERGTP